MTANRNLDSNGDTKCQVRSNLQNSLLHRHASLTQIERAFLSALLIDKPSSPDDEKIHKEKIKNATNVLSEDILFSIPFAEKKAVKGEMSVGGGGSTGKDNGATLEDASNAKRMQVMEPPKPTRSNTKQLDLWKAYRDGVRPKQLKDQAIKGSVEKHMASSNNKTTLPSRGNLVQQMMKESNETEQDQTAGEEGEDATSLGSDEEVGSINDDSTASSWNSSQGGFDHYDTWEVIRDEYAEDFGFKVAVDDENQILPYSQEDEDAGQRGMFKILGTSADDTTSLPHVLSPPMMDSLLNFVPDHLAHSNFWLKYSLTRDGASLDVLRQYCRAATHTVLAIETTNGEVFGSFTSAPWRRNNKYFGTGESFLWRMRHGRSTPVHSLFEQAQLESEIDVFPFNGSNDYIQLCTCDKLALGGGGATAVKKEDHIQENEILDASAVLFDDVIYSFGLTLDENLLHGTTSPSATFGNGNLTNGADTGETFDVMNVEMWAFTSAQTENYAERNEMSTFFVRESISSRMLSDASSSIRSLRADDLTQESFYRRIGENDENESDRDAWKYANMMNPEACSPYASMGST